MSNNTLVAFDQSLPAHLRGKDSAMEALASGLENMGGFPVLSIRGSKWRIKQGGEETPLTDSDGDPIPSLGVVILGANEGLAKTYYTKSYVEGDDNAPDCWSMDGSVPDPSVENPKSRQCVNCPMNAWGSKINEQGTKTRACSDAKRLAVISVPELRADEPKLGPMLLRVPPASLSKGNKSLRALMKSLTQVGAKLAGVVVKLSFDMDSDYPKISFTPMAYLDEDDYARATELAASDVVIRITQTLEEVAAASAPAAAKAAVEEPEEPEEDEDEDEEEAAPTKAASSDEDLDAMFGDVVAEPAAPKKAAKKKATKKRAAKRAAPAKAASSDEAEDDEEDDLTKATDDLQGLFG